MEHLIAGRPGLVKNILYLGLTGNISRPVGRGSLGTFRGRLAGAHMEHFVAGWPSGAHLEDIKIFPAPSETAVM